MQSVFEEILAGIGMSVSPPRHVQLMVRKEILNALNLPYPVKGGYASAIRKAAEVLAPREESDAVLCHLVGIFTCPHEWTYSDMLVIGAFCREVILEVERHRAELLAAFEPVKE